MAEHSSFIFVYLQATLEDATGSTASVTELTATTKAARNRVRSFQRQLFA